jgi:hypothetical protein
MAPAIKQVARQAVMLMLACVMLGSKPLPTFVVCAPVAAATHQ